MSSNPPSTQREEFWRLIPAYSTMTGSDFLNPAWQATNSIRSTERVGELMGGVLCDSFLNDLKVGLAQSSMTIRLTPYLFSRIDWTNPIEDPIRRQFLPLSSEMVDDHPSVELDSLSEQSMSPVPGLVRRYPDKALLIAVDTCPVYCAFCTRSYAVGPETMVSAKQNFRVDEGRWQAALEWLRNHPDVEDVVISGGDTFNLSPRHLRFLIDALSSIPSIRRLRVATRGLSAIPSRIRPDDPWTLALLEGVREARTRGVAVALHVHFNHPNEISWVTEAAASLLFREGVTVRNQSVLLRGVNDDPDTMVRLIKRLGDLQISAYYVYQHDLVPGSERLRTSLKEAIAIEKQVRGRTAGFQTPTFVVDLPKGGGKRPIQSFETYDPELGVAIYRSPVISGDSDYYYYDPSRHASASGRMLGSAWSPMMAAVSDGRRA